MRERAMSGEWGVAHTAGGVKIPLLLHTLLPIPYSLLPFKPKKGGATSKDCPAPTVILRIL